MGESDVDIGGEEKNQANNAAKHSFNKGFNFEPKTPPIRRRSQISRHTIYSSGGLEECHDIRLLGTLRLGTALRGGANDAHKAKPCAIGKPAIGERNIPP